MSRLTIERLSHDSRGVTRLGGKVAFVAGALAGEVVEAELTRRHRRFDEYRLIDVLESSPDRVEPSCPLVGRCGGCDLQHLAASVQVMHKTRSLLEQIERQSGLVPEAVLPPLSAEPFAYRRRARLALSVPRRGGPPTLGFRAAGSADIVPIERCPVLVPELAALPGRLQQLLSSLDHASVLGHIELSLAERDDGTSLPVIYLRMVAGLSDGDRQVWGDFAVATQAYLALRVGEGPLEYLHRPLPEGPSYQLPPFDVRIGYLPGRFVQGNGAVNRALVGQVVEWVLDSGGDRVLDAFCGVGNFALPLARRGCEVTGVEVSPEAVAMARDNAARNDLVRASFEARDLNTDLRSLHRLTVDTAVLDPPRAGASGLVTALAGRRLPTIVYVSCAPATLARDAAILANAGYRLEKLRLVDMFPQTSHIESVSLFRWDRRAKKTRALRR